MLACYIGLKERMDGYIPLVVRTNSSVGYDLLDTFGLSSQPYDYYLPDVLSIQITEPGWWNDIKTGLQQWISGSRFRLGLTASNVSTYKPEIKLYAKMSIGRVGTSRKEPQITGYSMFAHFEDGLVPIWECIFKVGDCTETDYRSNVPCIWSYQLTSWSDSTPTFSGKIGGLFLREGIEHIESTYIGFFGDGTSNQMGYELNESLPVSIQIVTQTTPTYTCRKSFDLSYRELEQWYFWSIHYETIDNVNPTFDYFADEIVRIDEAIEEVNNKIDTLIGDFTNHYVSR